MTIKYLWVNRERPAVFSRRWFVVLAKRLLQFKALFVILFERQRLILSGVSVGALSIVKCRLIGRRVNLKVGSSSFLAESAEVVLHDTVEIGCCVVVNDGVRILTASHDVQSTSWQQVSNPIYIEDYAWIATGAILLPGVRIGKGAVVGAGAVVGRDVDPFSVVIGNPAKKVSERVGNLKYNPVAFCAPYEAWVGVSDE